MKDIKTQADKFREAARELETDDDEARFEEKLRGLVKREPLTDGAPSESIPSDGNDG